jgi:glycosyltransferase involved in cell wall biosynthesis
VTHGILDSLSSDEFDIQVLGINYQGNPHSKPYKIWPISNNPNDRIGYSTIAGLVGSVKPDILVLFNDPWVIRKWLYEIDVAKARNGCKVVGYFPIDGEGLIEPWIEGLADLDLVITYSPIAAQALVEGGWDGPTHILPHGVDNQTFFPIGNTKPRELAKIPRHSFVVFNGNRNQPRKLIDLTIKAFCLFNKRVPEAMLYLHMRNLDRGWPTQALMTRECRRHGLAGDNFRTTEDATLPVSDQVLNYIYNISGEGKGCGLNTSLGEGWGLVPFEQAACMVPQVMTDFATGPHALGNHCYTFPVDHYRTSVRIATDGGAGSPEGVCEALMQVYNERNGRAKEVALAAYNHVHSSQFSWEEIGFKFKSMLDEI